VTNQELFEKWQKDFPINRTARKYVAKYYLDYDDVKAAILCGIWEGILAYKENGYTYGQYIGMCVKHRVFTEYIDKYPVRFPANALSQLGVFEPIVDDIPVTQDMGLDKALENLSDFCNLTNKERQVITMRINGYGPREIQASVGCCYESVYKLLRNLRGKIQRKLQLHQRKEINHVC